MHDLATGNSPFGNFQFDAYFSQVRKFIFVASACVCMPNFSEVKIAFSVALTASFDVRFLFTLTHLPCIKFVDRFSYYCTRSIDSKRKLFTVQWSVLMQPTKSKTTCVTSDFCDSPFFLLCIFCLFFSLFLFPLFLFSSFSLSSLLSLIRSFSRRRHPIRSI